MLLQASAAHVLMLTNMINNFVAKVSRTFRHKFLRFEIEGVKQSVKFTQPRKTTV